MIRAFAFTSDGNVREEASLGPAMEAAPSTLVWVDMCAPDEGELDLLDAMWQFHPLAVEDCHNIQRRAKIERFVTHDFVVVLALDPHTELPLDSIAIRIFIRNNLVVTVYDKAAPAVERVVSTVRAGELGPGCTYGHLVHQILDSAIDEYTPLLDAYEEELDELGARVSVNPDHQLLERLLAVRHDLLVMKRIFLPHEEVVRRLMDRPELGADTRLYYRDVLDHLMVVGDTITLLLEVAAGAMQIHHSTTNDRLNKIMKYMAVISTLMLPMTVISGAFGMNFDIIPAAHEAWGFVFALSLMGASAAVLLFWFKHKRWF